MKIAIMTQPLGKNYGGIMQAWALQQVLKRMGHEPVTIDRQPDAPGAAYKLARLGYRTALRITGKRKTPIHFERHLPYILKNTQEFIKRRMVMSEPLDSTSRLKQHFECNSYDIALVGSDQTWRPLYSPNIMNFFLDFLPSPRIKKIAYAASFGVDNWEYTNRQTIKCRQLIESFDATSVREVSGVALCQNHFGITPEFVLDPTLLLSAEEYLNSLGSEDCTTRSGRLFSYILDTSKEKSEIVNEASKFLKLSPFSSQPAVSLDEDTADIYSYVLPPVEKWITSFHHSDFVVTDSFHGCVFAIIFKKPFLAIGNKSRGMARFKSLLGTLGLESRLITDAGMAKDVINRDIDWQDVSKRLDERKSHSLSFIEKAIDA